MPERALAHADKLDLFYSENKTPVGPLHGLPVSVKEMLGMNGPRQTAGYCNWWEQNKIACEDAHVPYRRWGYFLCEDHRASNHDELRVS